MVDGLLVCHTTRVKWYALHTTSTVYRKSGQVSEPNANDTDVQQRQPEPLRLTDQYIALLVLIFTKAGLLEVGLLMMSPSQVHTRCRRL